MFLLYDLIFLLYALIYLPYLLLTKRAYPGFGMRFGLFFGPLKKQIKSKANIWLHAVSVGEVMVIEGFIDQLRKNYPAHQLIVTATTKTGYMLACQHLQDKALVIPSPIDFSFVAGFFVSLINPKMYIAVETEIWPNLYRNLYLKKIPLVVINGRISDNSFGRYKAIRFLLKGILNQVSVWCMQSKGDAKRIMELGAQASRVVVTGNLKFDQYSLSPDASFANIPSTDSLWWVAGSTHPGEEGIVLDVYEKIVKHNPQWRLVIAPRHIERVPQIIELIARRNLKAVKFSQLASKSSGMDAVIVVDTIGQLRSLYSLASLVFVGKSLCVGGGHNVIEPAFYGKAIVIGPKTENFRDIIACFKDGNAIVQVEDVRTFESAIIALCADQSKRDILGLAARQVIAANQGATKRSLEYLTECLR
jgi:3-deoxy-D-manno-octulosonic-acid transferase